MTSPYPTNMVSVIVADEVKGSIQLAQDVYVTEKIAGEAAVMHAADAAILKKAGLVEDALAVANAIPDQAGAAGAYSYTIPANTFSGGSAKNVLSATKGDGTALPGWMSFNPDTRVLSGTAVNGTTAVKIIATSKGGQVVSDTFNVVIS